MQDSIDASPRTSPLERACDWAFRLALLLLIVVAPWPFGSVTPGPAAALASALLLLGGLFLLTRLYFGRAYRTPGWHWLAAALALVALQQLPLPSSFSETVAPAIARDYEAARTVTSSGAWHPMSLEPFQTRSGFLQLAGFLAAFWLASQLFRCGAKRRVLVYTVACLGVALALFAVFQRARYGTVLYGRFPVPSGTPYGPFVNHNHFAGFIEACGLLTLGAALKTWHRNASLAVLLGGTSALMGISLFLSHSRGGLIAAGVGLAVLAWLTRRHALILAGAIAVALFLAAFAPSSLTDRFSTLKNPGTDDSVQFRLDLWSDSFGIVFDAPALGTGLGTYAAVIPGYRSGPAETRAEYAESDWVQLLCETGFLGILVALAFFGAIGRVAYRTIEGERSQRARGLLSGLIAGVAALLVHGLYDFNLHIPSNALLFAIMVGLIAAHADGPPRRWKPRRLHVLAAAPLAVMCLGVLAVDAGQSRRLTRRIDPLLTDPAEFMDLIQELARSRKRVPQNAETVFLIGRLYNEDAFRSRDGARFREIRLEQAAISFRDAIRLAPARGRYWFELAWTEANRGNDALANELFERSLELEPHHSSLRANYALPRVETPSRRSTRAARTRTRARARAHPFRRAQRHRALYRRGPVDDATCGRLGTGSRSGSRAISGVGGQARRMKRLVLDNVHHRTVQSFSKEWSRFDQEDVDADELERLFEEYFAIFPWESLPERARGADIGCGSGRWAQFVAHQNIGELHCVDPSEEALQVSRTKLHRYDNVILHHASVDALPFEDNSLDFAYALGVLHHVPDPAAALASSVRALKKGAPFLVYLYYAFDNRPLWF